MSRSASFQAPPGFRESPVSPVVQGEVVASTYAIRSELARTDTGLVFEARDMMLDRLVAFKLAWRDPGLPSLIIEARRCAAVRDPCAVAIHGMGTHNGVEYVVGERVTGRLLADAVAERLTPELYLARWRSLVAAVAHAHESGIAIGDISGATVLVCDPAEAREVDAAHRRMVLGRLSLSQVPAFGPRGVAAPEIARGEVEAGDPAAAEGIDLYGLGCIALEMARGVPPIFEHASEEPPKLVEIRSDLPAEVSDLVEWLVAKTAAARPHSAQDVLAQLDAVIGRLGSKSRSLRVLVVDDEAARGRWLWSLARRAHANAVVEIATEGTDAAHKLNRDHPELVFVSAALKGVMNAFELCMYARGLDVEHAAQLAVLGEVGDRDRALFAQADATVIAADDQLAEAILERVRRAATEPPRRRKRITVSG